MDFNEIRKEILEYIQTLKKLDPKPEQVQLLHEMIELLRLFR